MSSEWQRVRLGEHVDACLGKMLDARKNKGTPQPYLGNSNVRWGKFDLDDLAEMRFEPHEEERYSLLPGDLVVCEGGEPGRCAIWTGPAGMKVQKALHRIRPKRTLDNYYLFYWFQYVAKAGQLEQHFTGTTIKHLTGKAIAALEVPLPPIGIQRAMVDVLRQFDDRITLLRETNTTLEAIAQALFKSWFVDFDPVRAKMENRAPEGMDVVTAALFPDSFEETELGAVPRGWKFSSLSDVSSYLNRGVSPKYVDDGGILVLNQKCIRDFSVDYAKGRRHDPQQRKVDGRYLALGDVLVNSTGVGTLGRVAQVLNLPEPAIVDSHVTVVRSGEKLSWPYLGQWMTRKQPEIEAMGEGSTGQTELSRAKLGDLMVLVPTSRLLAAFDSLVEPLKQRISLNERTCQTLATLRDTLLPRLISGQLQFPEVVDEN